MNDISKVFGLRSVKDYSSKFEPLLKDFQLSGNTLPMEFIDNETFIGVEVEVENVPDANHVVFDDEYLMWRVTADGSLRNSGMEFVSCPMKGSQISLAFQTLKNYLDKTPNLKNYSFTHRTSVHVHMNALDLTHEQVSTLVLAYILVEPFLYDTFIGGDRDVNIFSVPLSDSSFSNEIRDVLSSYSSTFVGGVRSWSKYTGLNLLPLHTQGTVEFRHMLGTLDFEKLNKWLNVIFALKQYALKHTLTDTIKLAMSINTTSEYSYTVSSILGEQASVLSRSYPTKTMFEETSTFIKNCLFHDKATNYILRQFSRTSKSEPLTFKVLKKLHKASLIHPTVEQDVTMYKNEIKKLKEVYAKLKKSSDISEGELLKYEKAIEKYQKIVDDANSKQEKTKYFFASLGATLPPKDKAKTLDTLWDEMAAIENAQMTARHWTLNAGIQGIVTTRTEPDF